MSKIIQSKCVLSTYPLGYFKEKGKIFFSAAHLIEEGNRKKFISLVKKDKKFKKIEIAGEILFTLVEENIKKGVYYPSYDHNLFFPKPIITKPDGYEYWEIASWKREFLEKLLLLLEDKNLILDYNILKFKEESSKDFIFPKIIPTIPEKQKEAIKLAFKEGYYKFPKKTNLTKLGRRMNISKQAYQKLLSKAEEKILPFILESK